jgi:hypothetical protein
MVVGPLEMDVTPVDIEPGHYWIMTIFDTTGSVGIDSDSEEALATIVHDRTHSIFSPMPDPFGTAGTYTGQRFNFYLVVEP